MKALSLVLIAGFVVWFASGCSVKSETRTCTYNDRPIDCGELDRINKSETPKTTASFMCGSWSCKQDEEYCLESVDASGQTVSSLCETLPSVPVCSNLKADAKRRLGLSDSDIFAFDCDPKTSGPVVRCHHH